MNPLRPDRLLDLDGVDFCRVCAPVEGGGCNTRAAGGWFQYVGEADDIDLVGREWSVHTNDN